MYKGITFQQWVNHFHTDHNNEVGVVTNHRECVLNSPHGVVYTEKQVDLNPHQASLLSKSVMAFTVEGGQFLVLTKMTEAYPQDM